MLAAAAAAVGVRVEEAGRRLCRSCRPRAVVREVAHPPLRCEEELAVYAGAVRSARSTGARPLRTTHKRRGFLSEVGLFLPLWVHMPRLPPPQQMTTLCC